jgi:cation:H+ antiporter
MLSQIAFVVAGIACAAVGGELFVRAIVSGARAARVSAGLVAATIAAFATSSPELAIAVNAALSGVPQVSLGDALGSNVVNIALILAIPLAARGLPVSREATWGDLPFALLVPLIVGISAFDGLISRLDALAMLALFIAWLVIAIRRTGRSTDQLASQTERLGRRIILGNGIAGLALLLIAGYFIVEGAQGLAEALGIPNFVIGATLVAAGTSVPELATVIVATLRKHEEVGLRAIFGSNIFNGLLIVPVAALIHPISIRWSQVEFALLAGVVTLLVAIPGPRPQLGRWRGLLLLLLYAAFVGLMLSQDPH